MATSTITMVESTTRPPPQEIVMSDTSPQHPSDDVPDLISKLHVIPTFTDPLAERQWAKEHLVGAFRIFAKFGYNDGAGGHISLRDPVNPKCFWINPYAVHFKLLKVSDLILVSEEGKPLTKTSHKVNRAGFMIHAALHKARPDVNAAAHCHSPCGRAWSAFGKPIEMLNQDCCMFYDDLSVYEGFGGVVLAQDEGERIAKALGPKHKNVILQNHGILTCGGTVDEAAAFFIALEQACQAQLLAEAAAANGVQKRHVTDEAARFTKAGSGTPEVVFMQFKPEYDLVLEETNGSFLS
ncbi:class II Aldolase and Adducin domain-containing protein [Colletotrichum gloeosporioides Cg-14]|uniref:Class II Aldolase and Adducin domain-containing protein n=1 Tax=Colletotrichum gloeosporioides (strain Cg-14) TaxID=1237896 RepID=T0LR59_COLGC|nr:class II Aldolase and Adducin domain-containing protein [Colletotrichum gloeosporioides Cg-14]